MSPIDDLPPLREVVRTYGLLAKKSLGQNFLFDLNLTSRIARSAGPLQDAVVIEVGPGPAFHVYLVPKTPVRSEQDVKDKMFIDLGGLRAFKGSQRYPIPPGLDLKNYASVIVWCERFGVLITPADLASARRAGL